MIGRLVPEGIDRRALGVLTLGHGGSDLCQGSVPALLPFMADQRGYDYSRIGFLYLCASIGSTLVQPLFGAFADRIRAGWLMPVGLVAGGAGLALAALVASFAATALAFAVAGLGVAAFHPEGARLASAVSAARRGVGMSLFSVGGNAGFALGPLLVTLAVVLGGLRWAVLVAAVPVAIGLVVWRALAALEQARPPLPHDPGAIDPGPSDWPRFALAGGSATLRTGVQFGLMAFVPLWVARDLGSSEQLGNMGIVVLLLAGATGTLIGGRLADRHGFPAVVIGSLAALVPLVLLVPHVGVVALFGLLILIGLAMDANFYPLVVIAQDATPRHVGFASGVTLGLSIGLGAGAAALLGVLADASGLELEAVGLLAIGALLLALPLRRERVPARHG